MAEALSKFKNDSATETSMIYNYFQNGGGGQKFPRIIFDRRFGDQIMPGTTFDQVKYKHNNIFFIFPPFQE